MNTRFFVSTLALTLALTLGACIQAEKPATADVDSDADTDADTDSDADTDTDTDTDTDADTDSDTDTDVMPPVGDGLTCMTAAPITGNPGFASLIGTFSADPSGVFSCDPDANNTAFFTYQPPTTGEYAIEAFNQSATGPYSRLVVYDGISCSNADTEILCETANDAAIEATVTLNGGQDYLIAFYTDGETYTMVNPQIFVSPIECGDGVLAGTEECDGTAFDVGIQCVGGGQPTVCNADCTADLSSCPPPPDGFTCDQPIDLTGAVFPVTQNGQFDDDPATTFSCWSSTNNIVWYSYVAPSTGEFEIQADNASLTIPYSRLVVLEGDTCAPFGPEVACDAEDAASITSLVSLVENQAYLIGFYTDGEPYTMVDPQIDITPIECGDGVLAGDEECDGSSFAADVACVGGGLPTVCNADCTADLSSCPPPPDGFTCDQPIDVTGAAFPLTTIGTFDDDPATTFSCASSTTNIVWYEYQAPATGEFEIQADNASLTFPYSRLVVLEGDSCAPFGPEVSCETISAGSISSTVSLVEDETYLIGFYTDGNPYTMVDPTLSITQLVCGDDIAQGSEACDGTDLNGAVCFDQVTPAGCAPDCTIDTSSCPPAPAGAFCDQPLDFTGAPLPVEATGAFVTSFDHPDLCLFGDPMANAIHYSFIATETGRYTFTAQTAGFGSGTLAFAIYDDTTCGPDDIQLGCGASFGTEVSATADLLLGEQYLMVFGGDAFSDIVDPSLTYAYSVCGDGIVELNEECDDGDLQGQICSDGVTLPLCDADCTLDFSVCPVPTGETCANPNTITGNVSEVVSLGSFVNDYNLRCGGPYDTTGPEYAYLLVLQDGETVDLSASSIASPLDDLAVAIAEDCALVETVCLDKGDDILTPSASPEVASYTNTTGGPLPVYLFVADYSGFDLTGDVMVEITVTP